jgi:hypothetical protein
MFAIKGIPARSWGALLLLFACLLSQAVSWPAHNQKAGGGEAAAAAIAVAQVRETCPHHPEGCPPDCLCPKDSRAAGATESEFPSGPAFTRCAGKALADAPAPGGLFSWEATITAVAPDPFRYLILPAPTRPAPGFRAEAGKIPIA